MLDIETFRKFIGAANRAHQQLCVWYATQNEWAKHNVRWNEQVRGIQPFPIEKFTKKHGCKYKNFWSVATVSTQHGWILGTARLFDPAYHPRDKEKLKPRLSFAYILEKLGDENLKRIFELQLKQHEEVLSSVRSHRDNVLAHNDVNFDNTRIEAGVENLYEWLEGAIAQIKEKHPHLSGCGVINVKYNEKLSQCGVEELFETLLIGEKHEPQ